MEKYIPLPAFTNCMARNTNVAERENLKTRTGPVKRACLVLLMSCMSIAGYATNWYTYLTGVGSTSYATVFTNWTSDPTGATQPSIPTTFSNSGDTWTIISNGSNYMVTSSIWTIAGNLVLSSTGSNGFSPNGTSITIGGNLSVINSSFFNWGSTSVTTDTIYIGGNLVVSGTAVITNNPAWSYITFTNTTSTYASPQTISWTSTGTSIYEQLYIPQNVYVQLLSNLIMPETPNLPDTVKGSLNLGNYTLNTNGDEIVFTSGASLYTANASGVNAITAGSFNMSTTSNYIFNGSVAQVTGTEMPATTGNDTINNTSGVTISGNTTVTNLDVIGTVTIGSSGTLTGNVLLNSVSNLVDNGILSASTIITGLATNGACGSSTLSTNVSGTKMLYQWQSASDDATWSSITGATNPAYTPTVTTYYRSQLTTSNTAYSQATPGVFYSGTNPAGTISGGSSPFCALTNSTLSDGSSGGTWSSGNTAVGSFASATSGVVTGVAGGTAVISYIVSGGCYATQTITVNPAPATITGTTTFCTLTTTTLTDGTSGGYWSSSNTAVGTITSATGMLTGVAAGTTVITYTAVGCSATATATVNTQPTAITGATALPVGTTATLADATASGTWLSSAAGVATIGSTTGIVTALAAGTSIISYTVGSCMATTKDTVNATSALVWYSTATGGDASVPSNWWSATNNTGYQPTLFSTTNTTWVFQSNMGSTAALTLVGNVKVVSGGTFTPLSSSTTTVGGNWANTGGTFTSNGGTVVFNGANTTNTIDTLSGATGGMTGSNAFNNLSFNASGTYTFSLSNAVQTTGNFNNSTSLGTISVGNNNLTIGGNWNCTGPFINGKSRIIMNGTGAHTMGGNL